VNRTISILAVTIACAFGLTRADTAASLRVGKAVPEAFSFEPLDVGMRKGFFAKEGIEIEETAFAGDAKMQQAMAADSLDIALGSGPAMAFIA
jgi:ABC-type nitrate/sulfonate/bicarbonate transport system substrate-binding protein